MRCLCDGRLRRDADNEKLLVRGECEGGMRTGVMTPFVINVIVKVINGHVRGKLNVVII